MLAISELHVAYGQSEVLHGLNVSVAPNEIVAIMGRNGMGKTNRDIAQILGLSPRTVDKHLEQIYAKLGVENRTAAAAIATSTARRNS